MVLVGSSPWTRPRSCSGIRCEPQWLPWCRCCWRARLRLPEFYWAPISTIVILLSPSDPFTLAWQRFAGTALGAVVGALIASFFHGNWWVYGAGIVVCGLLSGVLGLRRCVSLCRDHAVYRAAGRAHRTAVGRVLSPVCRSVVGDCGGVAGVEGVEAAGSEVDLNTLSSRAERGFAKRIAAKSRDLAFGC